MQSSPQTFYFSVVNMLDGGCKWQELHTVITCCENVAVMALVDDLKERYGSKNHWSATILKVTELEYNAIRTRLREDLEFRREKQAQQALLN